LTEKQEPLVIYTKK